MSTTAMTSKQLVSHHLFPSSCLLLRQSFLLSTWFCASSAAAQQQRHAFSNKARLSRSQQSRLSSPSFPSKQAGGVSVASLAAARRSAFSPLAAEKEEAAETVTEDSTAATAENVQSIFFLLNAHEQPLSVRQLEQLIHTLITLSNQQQLTLTQTDCLHMLQSLTRREVTCNKHLPYYLSLAKRTHPLTSPFHPYYQDTLISSKLSEENKLQLRRSLVLLSLATRADMIINTVLTETQTLHNALLQKAHRLLRSAEHRYMASRINKHITAKKTPVDLLKLLEEAAAAPGEETEERTTEEEEQDTTLPPSTCASVCAKTFPMLLSPPSSLIRMTANQTHQLSTELELLFSGSLPWNQQRYLVTAGCCFLADDQQCSLQEIDSLQSILPLLSRKIEVNSENVVDRILRWRVMQLFDDVLTVMQKHKIPRDMKIYDEIFRITANCAAIDQSLSFLQQMKQESPSIKPDLTTYQWLLRGVSLAQRWERPDRLAAQLLTDMKAHNIEPDLIVYNDIIRACDRAELHELTLSYLREMQQRQPVIEPNEITYQYVNQAYVCAGEEDQCLDALLTTEEDRKEVMEEIQEQMSLVDQMPEEEFFPALQSSLGDTAEEEDGELPDEEDKASSKRAEKELPLSASAREILAAQATRVKERMKAELQEDLRLMQKPRSQTSGSTATATAQSTA